MYYYMLKVTDMYSGAAYALIIITKITATDKNSNSLSLTYISVDSSEYWNTGSGVFSGTGAQWQTNRSQSFPHYLVFSSPEYIKNISITNSSQGYFPKNCELYISNSNLSSYTDKGWNKVKSFIMPNAYTTTTEIINSYYLINDNNVYKYFNKTTFLMSNITNNPPIANDYRNYGNEDLSYLCTSYNQEVLQMNNFATLGSGKYGYIDCNNKFLAVKSVNIKTTGTTPVYKKYLIQDNTTNTVYTYNGTTLVQSVSQIVDSSNFITNGFNDLTVITNTMWTNIFSDITHARILYYTDDTLITENDLTCTINSYRPIDDLQGQFTIDLFKDN